MWAAFIFLFFSNVVCNTAISYSLTIQFSICLKTTLLSATVYSPFLFSIFFSEYFIHLWSSCRCYYNLEVWHKCKGELFASKQWQKSIWTWIQKNSSLSYSPRFLFKIVHGLSPLCLEQKSHSKCSKSLWASGLLDVAVYVTIKRFMSAISWSEWKFISMNNCMKWFDYWHWYRSLTYALYITCYF
jgi:hypothetical protein